MFFGCFTCASVVSVADAIVECKRLLYSSDFNYLHSRLARIPQCSPNPAIICNRLGDIVLDTVAS